MATLLALLLYLFHGAQRDVLHLAVGLAFFIQLLFFMSRPLLYFVLVEMGKGSLPRFKELYQTSRVTQVVTLMMALLFLQAPLLLPLIHGESSLFLPSFLAFFSLPLTLDLFLLDCFSLFFLLDEERALNLLAERAITSFVRGDELAICRWVESIEEITESSRQKGRLKLISRSVASLHLALEPLFDHSFERHRAYFLSFTAERLRFLAERLVADKFIPTVQIIASEVAKIYRFSADRSLPDAVLLLPFFTQLARSLATIEPLLEEGVRIEGLLLALLKERLYRSESRDPKEGAVIADEMGKVAKELFAKRKQLDWLYRIREPLLLAKAELEAVSDKEGVETISRYLEELIEVELLLRKLPSFRVEKEEAAPPPPEVPPPTSEEGNQ